MKYTETCSAIQEILSVHDRRLHWRQFAIPIGKKAEKIIVIIISMTTPRGKRKNKSGELSPKTKYVFNKKSISEMITSKIQTPEQSINQSIPTKKEIPKI